MIWHTIRASDPDVPCDGCGRCDCFPCLCGATGHDTCTCDVDDRGRFACVGLDYGYVSDDPGMTVLCTPCYRKQLDGGS